MARLAVNLEELVTASPDICGRRNLPQTGTGDDSSRDSGVDLTADFAPLSGSEISAKIAPTGFKGLFTEELFQEEETRSQRLSAPKGFRRVLFEKAVNSPVLNRKFSPVRFMGQDRNPVGTKRKVFEADSWNPRCNKLYEGVAEQHRNIKAALSMDRDGSLVGDYSRSHCLPTVLGKCEDLKYVSPGTVADVLTGDLQLPGGTGCLVIDCRYPYEFAGGHIRGALNLYTQENLHSLLLAQDAGPDTVLIFHCEFSSERAPKRLRFLRSCDRKLNEENYPHLVFPEIYIMAGGYRDFFRQFADECCPQGYTPMRHEVFKEELIKYRAQAKSWTNTDRSGLKTPRMRLKYRVDRL